MVRCVLNYERRLRGRRLRLRDIVSMVVVFGRRFAARMEMNRPLMASRPT